MTASKQEPTYPVTETELRQIQNDCKYPDRTDCDYCSEVNADTGCSFSANILIEDILSRTPHSSQPVPDSTTLMQMAETEWHNREERFGLHDAISWTTGWMAGYLTPNKPDWSKEHDAAIRKAERERVLQKLILCVADMGFPIENKSNEFDDGRACAYGYFMRQINNLLETPNPSTNKCRCLVSDEQVAIEKELEGFPSEGDGY